LIEVGQSNLNEEVEDCWRMEWAYYNLSNWTKKLIQDPIIFYKKNRNIDYLTMHYIGL
jgi:hypothetical protein